MELLKISLRNTKNIYWELIFVFSNKIEITFTVPINKLPKELSEIKQFIDEILSLITFSEVIEEESIREIFSKYIYIKLGKYCQNEQQIYLDKIADYILTNVSEVFRIMDKLSQPDTNADIPF